MQREVAEDLSVRPERGKKRETANSAAFLGSCLGWIRVFGFTKAAGSSKTGDVGVPVNKFRSHTKLPCNCCGISMSHLPNIDYISQ